MLLKMYHRGYDDRGYDGRGYDGRGHYDRGYNERRHNNLPTHRWRGRGVNRRNDIRRHNTRPTNNVQHQPRNQSYPHWEVKAATDVLEVRAFDIRFALLLRRNGIPLRGESSEVAFHPNPKWHCSRDEYEHSYLPYGGSMNEQYEEETPESTITSEGPEKSHSDASRSGSGDQEGPDIQKSNSSAPGSSTNPIEISSEDATSKMLVLNERTEAVNKCDYCDHTGDSDDIWKHLQNMKHYSASVYETVVGCDNGDKKSLYYVKIPLKWVNHEARYGGVVVSCPFCPHEVFENVFLCAAHCDAIHNKPNMYSISDVVWKGKCEVDRSFHCKCSLQFNRLQKLNNHWKQNPSHFPSDIGKYMNNDHNLFFLCLHCSTKHWDFFFMANHAIVTHSKKSPEFTVLVMLNQKREKVLPPVKFPDGNKYLLRELLKLSTHTKQLHGAKSQAMKMIKEKIDYHKTFV